MTILVYFTTDTKRVNEVNELAKSCTNFEAVQAEDSNVSKRSFQLLPTENWSIPNLFSDFTPRLMYMNLLLINLFYF